MASQLIGTTETGWFNPGVNPPPFDMKLLLMVAGSRSEDCGRTFEPYTVVMTAYVQQQGPGDEYDDETAFDEYMSGDQTDFLDFQFDLKDDEGEVLDWYSDSIVAWAYYPLGIAQTAVNVERERQAALVPIVSGRIEDAVAVYCTSCSAEISVCVPDVPDIQPEQVAEMWNTQSPVEDLSALVQRLVRRLRKAAPDDDLADKAMDYLRRTGRLGSPLRGAEND